MRVLLLNKKNYSCELKITVVSFGSHISTNTSILEFSVVVFLWEIIMSTKTHKCNFSWSLKEPAKFAKFFYNEYECKTFLNSFTPPPPLALPPPPPYFTEHLLLARSLRKRSKSKVSGAPVSKQISRAYLTVCSCGNYFFEFKISLL